MRLSTDPNAAERNRATGKWKIVFTDERGFKYYPLVNPAVRNATVKAIDFLDTVVKRTIFRLHCMTEHCLESCILF